MTKYARPISVDAQTRMTDVFDTDSVDPKPDWWTDDAAGLDRTFANNADAWKASGHWFVAVPQRVQDGAVHTGTDYSDKSSYLNPDGSTTEDP